MMKILFSTLLQVATLSVDSTVHAPSEKIPISLTGYVDTYYFVNFNGVQSNLGSSGFERVFDQKANAFEIGLVQIKSSYSASQVQAVIDLTFGNHADLSNYGNKYSPLGRSVSSTALALKQAFINWQVTPKLSLTAGQYGTHLGYEVVDAPQNFNYSLSNLFANGPFYHTGIKLDYSFSDKLYAMIGITNGLDSKDDVNKAKGIQAQLLWKPQPLWQVALNYYESNEGTEILPNRYSWYDVVTNLQLSPNTQVGLNGVYGLNNEGSWHGAALYLKKLVTQKLTLGTRLDYFNNLSGGMYLKNTDGSGVSATSFTGTISYSIGKNLLLKPEFRYDKYKNRGTTFQLFDKEGKLSRSSQATLGGAILFYY